MLAKSLGNISGTLVVFTGSETAYNSTICSPNLGCRAVVVVLTKLTFRHHDGKPLYLDCCCRLRGPLTLISFYDQGGKSFLFHLFDDLLDTTLAKKTTGLHGRIVILELGGLVLGRSASLAGYGRCFVCFL